MEVPGLTRDRLKILAAASRGRVQQSGPGIYLRRPSDAGRRCDRDANWLIDNGLMQMGPDGSTYEPTGAGQALLDGVP